MTFKPSSFEWMGDRGLVIRFAEQPSEELTSHLAGLAMALRELDDVVDAAPGHQTVLVEGHLTHLKTIPDSLTGLLAKAKPFEGLTIEVLLTYDGEDMEWLCYHLSMTKTDFIEIHSSPTYQVRMIGSPGFIYLSEVDERIKVPRLDVPRTKVPEGAVGIGGRQTGIYGRTRPGGWRLVGTVSEIPEVSPGDRIKFVRR